MKGNFVLRIKDREGNPVERYHDKPILDTRVYEVQFPEGRMATYTANILSSDVFAQFDEEGRYYRLLDEIKDHKKDGNVLPKDDGFTETRSVRRLKKIEQGESWKCFGMTDLQTGWV